MKLLGQFAFAKAPGAPHVSVIPAVETTFRRWVSRRNVAIGIASTGLVVGLAFVVGPRLPLSCGTPVDHDPAIRFVVTEANHDCSYSLRVGDSFAIRVPRKDLSCGFDICWVDGLDFAGRRDALRIVTTWSLGYHEESSASDYVEFWYSAVATGTTELLPYRIAIHIEP